MKHGSTSRRSRSNRGGNRRSGGNTKTRVYDSNGPDVRIRGTSHQITEKYMNLAKDASSSGDYVLAESYLQHAEHYQRLINGWQEQVDDILSSPQPHLPSTPGNGISYPQNAYQLNKPVASGQDSNLGNGSKIKHQGLDRDDKDTRTSSRVSGNRQPELT